MTASHVAEVFSCIYYSIFLATALAPIAAARLWKMPAMRAGACRRHHARRHSGPDRGGAIRMRTLNRMTLGDRLEATSGCIQRHR
jgi:hypothetical protein